jgi:hypothetical protein
MRKFTKPRIRAPTDVHDDVHDDDDDDDARGSVSHRTKVFSIRFGKKSSGVQKTIHPMLILTVRNSTFMFTGFGNTEERGCVVTLRLERASTFIHSSIHHVEAKQTRGTYRRRR